MNFLTSLLICDSCPLDDLMVDIPNSTCPENIGQVQRYIFQRKSAGITWDITDKALNTPASIQISAVEDRDGWDVLIAAGDITHIVRTPLIGGDSVINPGSALTEGGGDNTTLNGKKLNNGRNPADGAARFDSLKKEQIAAFRKLECYAEANDLEVYFVNQSDKIIGSLVGNKFSGFDVQYFTFGNLDNQGFNSKDSNLMEFQLKSDWDESKHFITPTFSPLNTNTF